MILWAAHAPPMGCPWAAHGRPRARARRAPRARARRTRERALHAKKSDHTLIRVSEKPSCDKENPPGTPPEPLVWAKIVIIGFL